MKYKRIKIKGKILEVVTIGQLAKMCNRSVSYIRKMEQRDIFPFAKIRDNSKYDKSGNKLVGNRLYSVTLAKRLAEILYEVKQGVKITNEQQRQIWIAFQNEDIFINTPT